MKIEQEHANQNGAISNSSNHYRHAILNEITGPGLTRYLDIAGNIFVLIDEFDGDHQKLGMFGTETKSSNTNSSAASVLKSFHTGIPYYQKGKVSDSGHLKNPQVSFLAASNGAPVMDILRAKMKSSVMPDAMVMRTIFDVIDSPPKFNSNYKNKLLPPNAIGLELLLLSSSLVCNQTYEFDTEGDQSANEMIQNWQDMCVAAGARWKNIDRWVSSRFAKTSELIARLAAQLTHIDVSYSLLQEFISVKQIQNPNGPVSLQTYCQMVEFFHSKFPPYSNNSIIISRECIMTAVSIKNMDLDSEVEAAIHATEIILLKFFNLFDLTIQTSNQINEIPWIPPSSHSNSNPAVIQIPATQPTTDGRKVDTPFVELCREIISFPGICFTFTQLINKYPKLKYRYKAVEPILVTLVEMKLLWKIENGLRSGRNICDIYIKSLPPSLTLNTVNAFVVEYLDPMKLPWTLYKASCERVLLPSTSAVLSQKAREFLEQENYKKIIEKYETSASTKKNQRKRSKETSSNTTNSIDESEGSTDGDNNTSLSNDDRRPNHLQEKEIEQPQKLVSPPTPHSTPKSSQSKSSIRINSRLSQPSSSSQLSMNYLLPRPPPPVLRISNMDNITDPTTSELTSNNPLQNDDLSMNDEEVQPTIDLSTRMDDENGTEVRRSARPRNKKRRLYSPEPISNKTHLTTKKKKTSRANKAN